MKKGLAITLISVIALVAIVFGSLFFTNNAALTKQIEALNADVANRDGQIEALNADVADRDGQIEALNADVANRDGQIEALNADVANRDGQIEALNADVADRDGQIEALNADIADRDGQIEALNADVADRDGQIEALNADVADRDGQIEVLSGTVAEQAELLDYPNMDEESLLAVVDEITPPLEDLGYSVMARNYYARSTHNGKSESTTETMFLDALVKGLEDRWTLSEKYSISTMTDQQVIEFYQALVMSELNYLSEFNDLEFSDAAMAEYAHKYISALEDQLIGISEYYGKEDTLYSEYWNNGRNLRSWALYWINRKYGISVSDEYTSILSEMVETGKYIDTYQSINRSFTKQFEELDVELTASDTYSVSMKAFTIKNDTSYSIENLTLKMNLYDANGNLVNTQYFSSENNISSGQDITLGPISIYNKFDHFDFSLEYYISGTISGSYYYEQQSIQVAPLEQVSWNGTIIKGGKPASGQPVFSLEGLTANWGTNKTWNKTLYVPILKFSVKNIGDVESDMVTVHVVFTNENKNEIWSEETEYVIGSSDGALKPGFSKKVFIYSSVGYESTPSSVPVIVADIYINNSLIDTVTVSG